MSRFGPQKAYSFRLRRMGRDHYRMSWTIDKYYPESTLRFPKVYERDTDTDGAARFAKRHRLEFTPDPQESDR